MNYIYNNQNPINEQATATIPQMPSMDEEPPIMRKEVANAIENMTDWKAPGFDCVTGEEMKASREAGIDIFPKLCNEIWDTETFPEDWGRAIFTLSSKKKDKLDCSNYWGIRFLSHAGKILTYILQKRIPKKTEEIPAEAQAGFQFRRSTVDQLFSLRQISDKILKEGIYIAGM